MLFRTRPVKGKKEQKMQGDVHEKEAELCAPFCLSIGIQGHKEEEEKRITIKKNFFAIFKTQYEVSYAVNVEEKISSMPCLSKNHKFWRTKKRTKLKKNDAGGTILWLL